MSDAEIRINTQTRHITLDALRGFAVMGILAANIIAFSMPEMAYINPKYNGTASQADIISWVTSFILIDGKMRGLFSLLFGASMMLIIDRSETKGESPASVHYRRMGWLAIFGLAHFFFIWWGDILFLYAAVGCLAYVMKDLESRKLIKVALILYLLGFFFMSAFTGSLFLLQSVGTGPDATAEMAAMYEEVMSEFSAGESEFTLYGGGYLSIIAHRFTEMWFNPFAAVFSNILETLPFMMIGMALLKNGFLTGLQETATYRKWAVYGLLLGGLGYVGFAWLAVQQDFDTIIVMNIVLSWTYPFRLLMIIGFAALFILIIKAAANSHMMFRVAAAGRVAFTNYLGTSIVMTTIFYGYGFDQYGQISRSELWIFVFAAWAFMLLWSKPWLENFHYGPLEWLWRSLSRGEMQPFKRYR